MAVSEDMTLYLDPSRCDGCMECVQACASCETHPGVSLIQVESLDDQKSGPKSPVLCMHCDNPTCAKVCPTDAIKKSEDGVVHTARTAQCVACSNCVLACPFGVPTMQTKLELMMKCDLCYDRTSVGLAPRCAEACKPQAIVFASAEEIAALRPDARPIREFRFGGQSIKTRVQMLMPKTAGDLLNITVEGQAI